MRLEADRNFFACDYCRRVYFPEANADGIRVLGEPARLECPVCAIPLVHAAAGDRRILYCNQCRGMLVPMDDFFGMVQDLRSRHETSAEFMRAPNWKDLDRKLRCPQCHDWMDAHPYGGPGNVIIDACENCAFNWLDYGELDRIVRAPDPEYASRQWKIERALSDN